MPPKKKRNPTNRGVAKPKPKPKAPQRFVEISTNGSKFTVLSYLGAIGWSPLEAPREYEILEDRVHNAFVTLRVSPDKLQNLLQVREARAAGLDAGPAVVAEDTDSAQETGVAGTEGEGLQQGDFGGQEDSGIGFETAIDETSREQVEQQASNRTLEVAATTTEDSERRDSVLEPGEIVESPAKSASSQASNTPGRTVITLEFSAKSYWRKTRLGQTTGLEPARSPDTPAFSPITPSGFTGLTPPANETESSVETSHGHQIKGEAEEIETPGLDAKAEPQPVDSEVQDEQFLDDDEALLPGKRELEVTAHNACVTLKFNKRKREFEDKSFEHPGAVVTPPIKPRTIQRELPVTTHNSYLTLKVSKQTLSVFPDSFAGRRLPHSGKKPQARPKNQPSRSASPIKRETRSQSTLRDTPAEETLEEEMAPVKDPNDVSTVIKAVVERLYYVQTNTHGYIADTDKALVENLTDLTKSLSTLRQLTDQQATPNNPIHDIRLPPEIVDYVDEGRNPDIFTRDFVENVQRGNAVLNGKKQAFRDFSVVFAQKLKEGIKGVDQHVDRIMVDAGLDKELAEAERKAADRNGQQQDQTAQQNGDQN